MRDRLINTAQMLALSCLFGVVFYYVAYKYGVFEAVAGLFGLALLIWCLLEMRKQ